MNINDFVSSRTEDLGPFLFYHCPHCKTLRWFNLRKHIAAISVLGVDLAGRSTHIIHCVKCDYIMDVPPAETGKAVAFLPVAAQFAAGKLTEKDYLARQAAADFKFLKDFAESRAVWRCSRCGTESAMDLPSCWSCGSPRSNASPKTSEPPPLGEDSYENRLAKYRKGPPTPPAI